MTKQLVDKESIAQVLGCFIKNPNILEEKGIELWRDDFPELFHTLVYATAFNLHLDGAQHIDSIAIDSYLSKYPNQYSVFNDNNGVEYIERVVELAELSNFEYNFNRVRKFTMLRELVASGIDISDIYDDTIISQTEHEEMQGKFDKMSISDISNAISGKFMVIEDKFLSEDGQKEQHAGLGMAALKESLKENPEYGSPLNGDILNTITRGARRKKLYAVSASSGSGKSRLAIGNAMKIGLPCYYCHDKKDWVSLGVSEPVMFITTELEEEEVQTMMIAYASGINEEVILNGSYTPEEEAIVDKAIEIIESSPIRLSYTPNFNIEEIERVIKRHIMAYDVRYVFFDYLHSSMKLLEEIATASRGMALREDNVLYMFSASLKQMCNDHDVFIYTGTQVNGDYKHATVLDEGVLRGA